MDAEQVLVIILAGALAILLVVSIIVVVKLLYIINRAKKIADQVEQLTDKAGTIASVLKKSATPLAIGKVLTALGRAARKKSKKGK